MTAAAVAPTFTADDVLTVSGEVWESCLAHHGDPLQPGTGEPLEGEVARALIRIAGGWDGVVTLEMSGETARTAACAMLESQDVQPEDVADAVGELVNIIGGNLKSLLPAPSTLSLPEVQLAARSGIDGPATERCRVDLTWGARPILVRVWS